MNLEVTDVCRIYLGSLLVKVEGGDRGIKNTYRMQVVFPALRVHQGEIAHIL